MRKALYLSIVLTCVSFLLAGLYFSSLYSGTKQNTRALSIIPAGTALVAAFHYDSSFQDIFKDYELFNVLLGPEQSSELNLVKNRLLKRYLRQSKKDGLDAFVAVYPISDSLELLWVLTQENQVMPEDLFEATKTSKEVLVSSSLLNKTKVYEVSFDGRNMPFYFYTSNQVILGSFSKALIERTLETESSKISEEFLSEITSNSQKNSNSPFNIFINHHALEAFSSSMLRTNSSGNLELLKDLRGFSTLNMNYKSDALMFNGTSSVDTLNGNFLSLFINQRPVPAMLNRMFPGNTANFIEYGISDNKRFHADLRQLLARRSELAAIEDRFQKLTETGINFTTDLGSLWGKEFASVQLSTGEKLVVIQTKNGARLTGALSLASSEGPLPDVRKFDYSDVLYYFFGDPLKQFRRPFFSILDNYMVVANTASTVADFSRSYKKENSLSRDSAYMNFNQFVANKSNIFYFIHNANSKSLFESSLKPKYSHAYVSGDWKGFYGFAFQWASDGNKFLSNSYANYHVRTALPPMGTKDLNTEATPAGRIAGQDTLVEHAVLGTSNTQ